MLAEMKAPDRTKTMDTLVVWASSYTNKVRFVDVYSFVSHYTKDIRVKQEGCRRSEEKLWRKNSSTYVLASIHDRVEEGEPAMGLLRVISKRGDDRVHWNEQDALTGDAEAMAAIREADRIFVQERARGATAFRVVAGMPVERLEQFDPQAEQIILVPRVVGG